MQSGSAGTDLSPRTLFFSFSGRINRPTYWTRAFPVLLALGLFVVAAQALEYRALGTQGVVSLFLSLVGLWPVLAVTVKRLHDRGRSAWFLLVLLIPVLGPIWLLIEIWTLPGAESANRFGDAPRDKGLERQWIVPFEIAGVAALISLLAWTFFWPGAEFTRALRANGYELVRMDVAVSGRVPLPAGNSLIFMQVDGTARVGDVTISQCAWMDDILTTLDAQVCRLDGFVQGRDTILIGHPERTPAFSVEAAEGRAIVILNADPSTGGGWLIEELNRPVHF